MSSIKPSLHEVLSYSEESRRMLMQGFADAVDRVAANNRRTDIELFQVCKALGEPNVPTLLSLREEGLPAYKAGAWRIDCRSFRKWATTLHAIPAADETTNHI